MSPAPTRTTCSELTGLPSLVVDANTGMPLASTREIPGATRPTRNSRMFIGPAPPESKEATKIGKLSSTLVTTITSGTPISAVGCRTPHSRLAHHHNPLDETRREINLPNCQHFFGSDYED